MKTTEAQSTDESCPCHEILLSKDRQTFFHSSHNRISECRVSVCKTIFVISGVALTWGDVWPAHCPSASLPLEPLLLRDVFQPLLFLPCYWRKFRGIGPWAGIHHIQLSSHRSCSEEREIYLQCSGKKYQIRLILGRCIIFKDSSE